ncbi:MAG: sulfatase-like hydrolase/transferase [Acidimicrobiia bacterium]|nr:sulfatase-like hydrolase/transferase [Acidimicrobiia bacterium]MDH5238549.1 sulfatase-like hydrolase/transferase [Acidimicrobiia bacterium]
MTPALGDVASLPASPPDRARRSTVTRRTFVGGAMATVALPQLVDADRAGSRKRHTLLLVIDDMAELVSDASVQTPHLDALARQSVVYHEAHAPVAICASSRAAFLTGISPDVSGLVGHHDRYLGAGCDPCYLDVLSHPSVFDQAHRRGFRTEGYGKISHGPAPGHANWFDVSDLGQEIQTPYLAEVTNDPTAQNVGSAWWSLVPKAGSHPDSRIASTAAKRIRMIDRRSRRPCLIAVGISQPHMPWRIPARFWNAYRGVDLSHLVEGWERGRADLADVPAAGHWERAERAVAAKATGMEEEIVRAYCAAVSFADAKVGRVMRNVPDDWSVVVTSDHGWMLGEKLTHSKATAWRSATRVPAMVRIAGQAPTVVNRPVTLLDLPQTVLGAMAGEARGWARPRPYVNTWWETTKTVYWRDLHYLQHGDGSGELYHLTKDPRERDNLMAAGKRPSVLNRLRRML